jgi:DNA-binding HxlR family transcriptional regulator
LKEHQQVRYSVLLKNLHKTRGALASSLHDLRKMKLIERIVSDKESPLEVSYLLTEKGAKTVQLLDSLQRLITS